MATNKTDAIRPFSINFPDEALTDLRRRIEATRWPEQETVADESQGVRLAMGRKLALYRATGHDSRKCEAKLNAVPQFMTRSTGSTFISFMFVPNMKTPCR